MPNVRSTKQHWYNPLTGEGAYLFDTLGMTPMFYLTGAQTASVANTTVQDVFVVPQRCVIPKLVIVYHTGAAYVSGSDKWNVVMNGTVLAAVTGTTETGASPAAQTVGTAGQSLFAADKAFAQASVSKFYCVDGVVPDVPEAVWDTNTLLTLRLVTTSAAGTHLAAGANFSVQVFGLLVPIDPTPMISSANPATDF